MAEKSIFIEIKEKLEKQNRPTEDIEKIEQAYLFAKKLPAIFGVSGFVLTKAFILKALET